jgi:threonylcarbamoyladenosine tRNA methylthiotransferase MtaB
VGKTVSFKTFGCKLNFSETSTIAREFREKGFETVGFGTPADVVLINTCTVTGAADKKCRQAIRQAKQHSPNAYVVVTGCYAQADAEKLAKIPGVNLVLGMNEKFNFFKYTDFLDKEGEAKVYSCETGALDRFDGAFSSGDRTRSFLKIQDGCDYPCTYCTIPAVRGKSRSGTITDILQQAEAIAQKGFKEIILTGVNIGDFGKLHGENFYGLIQALDRVQGIERYRISSIEPNLISDEIIRFVADSSKFLPHFHIPLQSGSDLILKQMKRRYSSQVFRRKIEKIRELMPDTFFGIDVIVGFPGEGEYEFEETYHLLDELNVSYIHVFSYSIRPGTPAGMMEAQISDDIIKYRSERLHDLSKEKQVQFYNRFLNTEQQVLFESSKKGNKMFGFTGNYIRVESPYRVDLINKVCKVKIEKINSKGNAEITII